MAISILYGLGHKIALQYILLYHINVNIHHARIVIVMFFSMQSIWVLAIMNSDHIYHTIGDMINVVNIYLNKARICVIAHIV
jgi:hypothetical protein